MRFREGVGYVWTGMLWSVAKLTPLTIMYGLFLVWK